MTFNSPPMKRWAGLGLGLISPPPFFTLALFFLLPLLLRRFFLRFTNSRHGVFTKHQFDVAISVDVEVHRLRPGSEKSWEGKGQEKSWITKGE